MKYFKKIEGIYFSTLAEDFSGEDMDTYIDELLSIYDSNDELISFVTDISEVGMLSTKYRNKITEAIKPHEDKVYKNAMVVDDNPIKKTIISIMLSLSGRKNIKIFSDKNTAVKWVIE